MSGRLLPRKGFQYVLEALKDIKTDYEIHIAGDGPYRGELERMAGEFGLKVVFHGWLNNGSPELNRLYETSSIFVMPSSSENASVSLLEAMLGGMAMITSNISGCPETLGDSGLLVRPDNVEDIRESLLKLIHDEKLCRELGEKARKRAQEAFDWKEIAKNYIKQYEKAVRD
jgi:glycosyltransferase involved in cell wall biosynthesis